MASKVVSKPNQSNSSLLAKKDKPRQIRQSNIDSAKALGDAVRTSLGPRGMDKMIFGRSKNVTISNDGATILKEMKVTHPIAQILTNTSHAQDIEAGDGTTTVVIYASGFLGAAEKLLKNEIHPTKISDGFKLATELSEEILRNISISVDLKDRESLIKNATTSLSSKVVSQNSPLLAGISVDAVLHIIQDNTVDLRNIRVITKLGGTLEDTELITNGLVLKQRSCPNNSINKVVNAKIGLIQFCLSPPKTDMENNIIVSDYTQMDRILREQRMYVLNLCKLISKTGCNVLLIQKSILRDSITEIGISFLNKLKIMVVDDIERDEIDFICRSLSIKPVSHIDHFTTENLCHVQEVAEIFTGFDKYIKITGVPKISTVSIVVRGSNDSLLQEAGRSLHDALCVIRSIVKGRYMIAGGGAAEIELALKLEDKSRLLAGTESFCVREFARSLELVPITLVESAGLNPVEIVSEIRKRHASGEHNIGFNVKKASIRDMVADNVVQPLLVTSSALKLASETVRCILKIDDMVSAVR